MSEQPLSQEEIQKRIELAKQNCIFCKIASREVPSKIVYEDDIAMAILDIGPATTGHLLLFPKEHYMLMPMVPDEVLGRLGVLARYLSELLVEAFDADDVTLFVANGAAAGQQVQHFMYHLIPQYKDQNVSFSTKGNKIAQSQLQALSAGIKERLNALNSAQQ